MRRFILLFLFLAGPLSAEPVEVDLELVLAVDISRSMSHVDLATERRGYGEALTSAEVLGAIRRGLLGRIGLTYVEWSDSRRQRVIVPWTLIETAEDAAAAARLIARETGGSTGETSISAGLLFAAEQFEVSPFTSYRQVIDISGDGPNNEGAAVTLARDRVLARGITINGLPLMVGTRDPVWHLPDLDGYYTDCVIGGPGAFALPVRGWQAFPDAIRRKLVLEIAGKTPPARARLLPASGYDCLIGEKIRNRRRSR